MIELKSESSPERIKGLMGYYRDLALTYRDQGDLEVAEELMDRVEELEQFLKEKFGESYPEGFSIELPSSRQKREDMWFEDDSAALSPPDLDT